MSSKTKTTNLGLNHWELDDVFQMDDFNQDNAKIDAAMGLLTESLAGNLKAELLDSVKPKSEEGYTYVKFNIKDVDFGEYMFFIVVVHEISHGYIYINNNPKSMFYFKNETNSGLAVYFPLKNGNASLTCIGWGGENGTGKVMGMSCFDIKYSSINEIGIGTNMSAGFPTQSSALLWGIK